jgi:hypothetical protein
MSSFLPETKRLKYDHETSANKPTVAVFYARVALTARPLMDTLGTNPTITLSFRLGCSVVKSVMDELML